MTSVTTPAGFVIEIVQACGAISAIRRADRLLPDHPGGQSVALVADAAVQAAYPQRREHEINAFNCVVEIDGGTNPGSVAAQDAGDHIEALWRGVLQDDLVEVEGSSRQRPVQQRHPETAAAQHRSPHRANSSDDRGGRSSWATDGSGGVTGG
jgi:hypothetical protein